MKIANTKKMIVEFSVKNYRSIKELQTISFSATNLKSSQENLMVDDENILFINDLRLLRTIGIYGSNASGKSNILKALNSFLTIIDSEPSPDSKLDLVYEPFLFVEDPFCTECFFQIVFLLGSKKFRYGFTVKRNEKEIRNPEEKISKYIISSEWLFGTKEKNMVEYFTRTGLIVNKDKLPNNEKIPPLAYEHALFLTHSAAFDNDSETRAIRSNLTSFLFSNMNRDFSFSRWPSIFTIDRIDKKNEFLKLLEIFDLKYSDIIIQRDDSNKDSLYISRDKIFMSKKYLTKDNVMIERNLSLENNESSGTQKLFDLVGSLYIAFNLGVNSCFIIDEVDSNFHPSLLIKVINLFNNRQINKNNAQLIFSSHDTNLLSPKIMRRDQFYFCEKQDDNSTRLYSLADLKGIRNDADFAKQYLAGYYGALPVLDNYTNE